MLDNWPLLYLTAVALWGAAQIAIGMRDADAFIAETGEDPLTAWEIIKAFANSTLAWPVELIELVEDMVAE